MSRQRIMKLALASLLIGLIAPPSWAIILPKCKPGNHDVESQASLIHKIVLMGADNRISTKKFAAKKGAQRARYEQAFSAVGLLDCGSFVSTAQLTGANNVITSAAHPFFDKDCKQRPNLNTCFFVPSNQPGAKIRISWETAAMSCPKGDPSKDWLVAKLERHIDGVRPFDVPNKNYVFKADQKIIQLAAAAGNRSSIEEQTATSCSIRDSMMFQGKTQFTYHDCDTGYGSSGGAQVAEDNPELLLGIHLGGRGSKATDGAEYNANDDQKNVSMALQGAFLDAIHQMTRQQTATN